MQDNDDNHDNRDNHDHETVTSTSRLWRAQDAHAAAGIEAHTHPAQRYFPCAVKALSPRL
jgi:hypothetical protein